MQYNPLYNTTRYTIQIFSYDLVTDISTSMLPPSPWQSDRSAAPWRWRHLVAPKRRYLHTILQALVSQTTFIFTSQLYKPEMLLSLLIYFSKYSQHPIQEQINFLKFYVAACSFPYPSLSPLTQQSTSISTEPPNKHTSTPQILDRHKLHHSWDFGLSISNTSIDKVTQQLRMGWTDRVARICLKHSLYIEMWLGKLQRKAHIRGQVADARISNILRLE